MKKSIFLTLTMVFTLLAFQNCGVFGTQGKTFSSLTMTDSLQGIDVGASTVVPDTVTSLQDIPTSVNVDAVELFEETPGVVTIDQPSNGTPECVDDGVVRFETVGEPESVESPTCMNKKRRVTVTHKRRGIKCIDGSLQTLPAIETYSEEKTVACDRETDAAAVTTATPVRSGGEIIQVDHGEIVKQIACPRGQQGRIYNLHKKVLSLLHNVRGTKILNFQAGKIIASKNNCRPAAQVSIDVSRGNSNNRQPTYANNHNNGNHNNGNHNNGNHNNGNHNNGNYNNGNHAAVAINTPNTNVAVNTHYVNPATNNSNASVTVNTPNTHSTVNTPNTHSTVDTSTPTQTVSHVPKKCTSDPRICEIYQRELGRLPDQSGSHFWTAKFNELEAKHGSDAAFVAISNHVRSSSEATTGRIPQEERDSYQVYSRYTGTDRSLCQTGTSCENVKPEIKNAHNNVVSSIVEGVYQETLGRASDSTGKAYWDAEAKKMQDSGMSYSQIEKKLINHFKNSAEYKSKN